MFTARFLPLCLIVLWLQPTLAADREADSKTLIEKLRYVHPAYKGKRFEAIRKRFQKTLHDRNIEAWKKWVEDGKGKANRTSFLAEYFAYSEDCTVLPIDGIGPLPVKTTKLKVTVHLFRPGKSLDGEEIPKNIKSMTYLIIRSEVATANNPYGIALSKAYRGLTMQQRKDIVETYRKAW